MSHIPAPFDPKYIDFIRRIISVAETGQAEWDPASVYIYKDDNRFKPPRKQVTLSIGFTEGGGNLLRLLEHYEILNGVFAAQFAPYLPTMGRGESLASDPEFIALLKKAGKEDPLMTQAQQEMFDRVYMAPAFAWADRYGFTLPLSYLVITDSFLHSGSMLDFLMDRFAEPKPANGGDEKKWINDYTTERRKWLANHSNKILNNTVYRPDCFLTEIKRSNWDLEETPVVMNGTKVTYA
jgi:chitosanase